jgi:hypothetical protein
MLGAETKEDDIGFNVWRKPMRVELLAPVGMEQKPFFILQFRLDT